MTPARTERRFALLDRDGTINHDRGYIAEPGLVELLPGAAEGLRRLRAAGFGLAVVTNQSGIGRGLLDEARLERIHARLAELLLEEGIVLDGIYFCPHAPEAGCACRKPATALAERAAAELGFEPREAVMIGDKVCDIELGRALGATTILVRSGYGRLSEGSVRADHVVDDLAGAAAVLGA